MKQRHNPQLQDSILLITKAIVSTHHKHLKALKFHELSVECMDFLCEAVWDCPRFEVFAVYAQGCGDLQALLLKYVDKWQFFASSDLCFDRPAKRLRLDGSQHGQRGMKALLESEALLKQLLPPDLLRVELRFAHEFIRIRDILSMLGTSCKSLQELVVDGARINVDLLLETVKMRANSLTLLTIATAAPQLQLAVVQSCMGSLSQLRRLLLLQRGKIEQEPMPLTSQLSRLFAWMAASSPPVAATQLTELHLELSIWIPSAEIASIATQCERLRVLSCHHLKYERGAELIVFGVNTASSDRELNIASVRLAVNQGNGVHHPIKVLEVYNVAWSERRWRDLFQHHGAHVREAKLIDCDTIATSALEYLGSSAHQLKQLTIATAAQFPCCLRSHLWLRSFLVKPPHVFYYNRQVASLWTNAVQIDTTTVAVNCTCIDHSEFRQLLPVLVDRELTKLLIVYDVQKHELVALQQQLEQFRGKMRSDLTVNIREAGESSFQVIALS